MRRALRFWPALAVLCALVLALLAHGVLAAARDARSGTSPGPVARVGEALVATGDDRAFRRALALVAASSHPGLTPGAAFKLRALAEAALARETHRGPARQRARAAHLLAVLALRDAAVDTENAQQYAQAAVADFQNAIRLDPGDAASKYDLELLLTLRGRSEQKRGPGKQTRGASGSAPGRAGSGY